MRTKVAKDRSIVIEEIEESPLKLTADGRPDMRTKLAK